ncbi:Transposon Ty3-I Gag-Pol polyprotein [Ceratobasidium sp. AG-Ba]|nr:Transposon Ty3-I Gag-Pol polyprotein [Ceratobasidium sp. AG-Ba]
MADKPSKSGASGAHRASRNPGPSNLGGSSPSTGPIQTPGSFALFGGNSQSSTGISPSLSQSSLPGAESASKETGAHTATPGTSTVSVAVGDAGSEAGPTDRASHQSRSKSQDSGKPGGRAESSEDSEDEEEETPRRTVRFEDLDDEELERQHRDALWDADSEILTKLEKTKKKLDEDLESHQAKLEKEFKKRLDALRVNHAQKSQLIVEKHEESRSEIHKALMMSAAEIRENVRKEQEKEEKEQREKERKEKEAIRRERGSILSTQAQRDAEILKSIYEDPDRLAALEGIKDEKLPTLTPKKPRVSLGTTVPVFSANTVWTPKGKAIETRQQMPSGGFLATALATSTPREEAVKTQEVKPDNVPTAVPVAQPMVAAGAPDGDDGSEGSSSSDDEYKRMDDTNRRAYKKAKKAMRNRAASRAAEKAEEKKRKEKLEKLKLSGYRTKLPFVYDGSANFKIYKQWMFEIMTWINDTGFDDEEAVRRLISFMKGRASDFYMYNVAPRPEEYDVKKLGNELFEYCFPADINARLRHKFSTLKQSDRGFKDFVRELQKFQIRFKDITDKQIAQRIWEGAHSYLRAKWTDAGISVDGNPLADIIESGIRFEMAERIRRSDDDRKNKEKDSRAPKPFKPQRPNEPVTESNNVNYSGGQTRRHPNNSTYPSGSNTPNRGSTPNRAGGNSGNRHNNYRKGNHPNKPNAKLTKEQVEEYRAAGKCFGCAEVGHSIKDCPKRNYARPTNLSSSAVNYELIEELGAKRPEIEISAVDLDTESEDDWVDEDSDESSGDEGMTARQRLIDNLRNNVCCLPVNAARIKKPKVKPEIEWNSATPKDFERQICDTIVVEVYINGKSCRALIDSGSQGDLIASTVVDQLKIKTETLAKPIGLSMAVTGSRSLIKHSATVNLQYQGIDEDYRLDVANLDKYDLILGTAFMQRHSVMVSFNPHSVLVRSKVALPLNGPQVKSISSNAADIYNAEIEKIRDMLREESADICKTASETPLPPLRVINHRIPLIDENKVYSWRSSRCPEPLRGQWEKKMKAYLDSGRWKFATGKNAIPMLLIHKKGTEGESTLRTVLDKREQNANTYKASSPLPDIQEILWKVSQYQYRTLIDGKDAYEQIRVEPEDVPKTIFTTPSGTMVSEVMQIGDCNASATYQSLMNKLFAHGIGSYMHVFLDDIVIYTNTLEEHVRRVREVFDVLRKERFFLSPKKMQFLVEELHILVL